jgi:hypothetical protein
VLLLPTLLLRLWLRLLLLLGSIKGCTLCSQRCLLPLQSCLLLLQPFQCVPRLQSSSERSSMMR